MQISELGNLGLGASIPADVRARAEAQWAILENKAQQSLPRTGTVSTGKVSVTRKTAGKTTTRGKAILTSAKNKQTSVKPVVTTTTAPQTAAQAAAVNANVASDKDRARFVEDLIKASDNTLYDMIKAVAQQTKVGSIEYAMVQNYGAEIAAEARRRFGEQKAKELLDAAYIKSPAASQATTATTVTDPLAPAAASGTTAASVETERGVNINTTADEKAVGGGFLQQYGLVIGIGAVAVLALGFLFLRPSRPAPAPAPFLPPPAV